jgi:hypothetical protein
MMFRALFASSLVLTSVACSSSTPSSGKADGAASAAHADAGRGAIDGAAPHPDAGARPTDGGARGTDGSARSTDGGARGTDAGVDATVAHDATPPTDAGVGAGDADLDMQPSDFDCILHWTKVGDFRITNKLVEAGTSIAVAADPEGGVYPVGTVIQLIPNEAMAKRRAGWNATTRDWEFFKLSTSASGTVISQRGGAEVANVSGSCDGCHGKAEPQFDVICGTTHGCAPLPFTEAEIQFVQNGDPRCH